MTAPNEPGGPGRRGLNMPSAGSIAGTGAAALRGAALIAIAVVIGIALLAKGLTDDGTPVAARRDATEAGIGRDDEGDKGSSGETTTTTTAASTEHKPAEVTVWVLNGAGVGGIAAKNATTLKEKGYQTPEAANATGQIDKTIVYYVKGYEADAKLVAEALGLSADSVKAMPSPVPKEIEGGDIKGSHIVVILGLDRKDSAGTTTTTSG